MGAKATAPESNVTELVEDVIHDARKLLTQQVELFKQELREESGRAVRAAAEAGAGVGLVTLGGVLSAHALVHLLHRSTRLPLWGCYGLVGGLLAATGGGLLGRARSEVAGLQLAPQTTGALRENVAWLAGQTDGRTT
jgi:hypothetical protein